MKIYVLGGELGIGFQLQEPLLWGSYNHILDAGLVRDGAWVFGSYYVWEHNKRMRQQKKT